MNQVVIIGRTTQDIECRYTANQKAVAKFTVAVDDGYGEKKRTNFINCVAFGSTAENCEKFLPKGKKVAVQGHIQTGSYEKDGKKVYTTDVIAERVEFLEFTKPESVQQEEPTPQGFSAIDSDIPF